MKQKLMLILLSIIGLSSCGGNADQSSEVEMNSPELTQTAMTEQAEQVERSSFQDFPNGPYRLNPDWPLPLPDDRHSHEGWTWGSFGGVYAESPDRIWIAMRGELPLPEGAEPWQAYAELGLGAQGGTDGLTTRCEPMPLRGFERRWEHSIIVVDHEGNLVDEWPHLEELFSQDPCSRGPHKIKISPYDADKHVWIIDDQLHVIYRFTHDGELVHTLGQSGVSGRGPNTFSRPTDIAWLPDGTYFISDGYDGTRVAKFDADDNYIMDWGQAPVDPENPGPYEFDTVHSIAVSADRRVYAVDRAHQRMQVFDENGNFLDMWSFRSPHWPDNQIAFATDHMIDEDGYVWVGDASNGRINKFDLEGNFIYGWGSRRPEPGGLACSHGMTTDQLGNFYVADCGAGRVQKFEPVDGADQEKMVGQILRTWDASAAN